MSTHEGDIFQSSLTVATVRVSEFYDHAVEYAGWVAEDDEAYREFASNEWETVLDRWEAAYDAVSRLDDMIESLELQKSVETPEEMRQAMKYITDQQDDPKVRQACGATMLMEDDADDRTMDLSSVADLVHTTYLQEEEPLELYGLDETYTADRSDVMGTIVEEYTALARMNARYIEAMRVIEDAGPYNTVEEVPEHLRDIGAKEEAQRLSGCFDQVDHESWIVGETEVSS